MGVLLVECIISWVYYEVRCIMRLSVLLGGCIIMLVYY